MASRRRYLSYLLLALILVLALPACVRPFGQSEAEQAQQATQEAEAQAAAEVQAEEEASEAGGSESETEETAQEETETGAAEEAAEGEEAVSSDPDVGGGTPDTEEEAPTVDEAETEEATSAEEDTEAVEASEGETEMSEETSAEATAEEEAVEEAAAEDEMAAEPEAEESLQMTLPATHTVAPGENLFRIGLKYGISWIPLAVYNNIPNANLIYTGQVIRIPGGQAPPTQTAPEGATYTNYVVNRGDTLFKISRAFDVSPEEIVEANGLMNPNLIYAGQVLKIPKG